MHHPKLLDHFQSPRNAGELEEADAVIEVSNAVCGDILKLWVRLEAGRVAEARFKCRGCVASIACGSALTGMMVGREPAGLANITTAEVEEAVGELPATGKHAAALAVDACRAAAHALSPP